MVPLHDFTKPEAQVCPRCGARYGKCARTQATPPKQPKFPKALAHGSKNELWTEAEDDLLIELHWLEGMGPKSIATRLTRSISAIEHRIRVIEKRTGHTRLMRELGVMPL